MSGSDIASKVIDVLVDVLEIEADDIHLDAKIVDDLGADSLDVVDLSYSLGKELGIKMPQKSVIVHAEELADLPVVSDSHLTALGAHILQQGPNAYSPSEAYEGQPLVAVFSGTKVRHWVNLCAAIVESGLTGDELIRQRIEAELTPQLLAAV